MAMRIFLFMLLPLFLFSQNNQRKELSLLARYTGEKVILRWAPQQMARLQEGVASGYMIERIEVDSPFHLRPAERLTTAPLKALSEKEFEKMVKAGNRYSAAAAQAIYGKKEMPAIPKFDVEKAYRQSEEGQANLLTALLIADWDAPTATALGLRYEDKTALSGKRYLYRLTALSHNPSLPPDTTAVLVQTFSKDRKNAMPPVSYRASDQAIILFWEKPMPGFAFSGYYIERSEDDGRTYRRTSEAPRIFLDQSQSDSLSLGLEYFTDSVQVNYRNYRYRVVGLDAFGELSEPSNVVLAHGVDMTPPPAPGDVQLKQLDQRRVRISWKEPDNLPADFGGYLLSLSHNLEGGYQPLFNKPLGRGVTEYTDTSAIGNLPNFYRVTALDTSLNVSHSRPAYYFYKDGTPPGSPSELTGEMNDKGIVTLHWRKPKDADILGYTVERANDPTHQFTPITSGFLADTVFYDSLSLKTLSRKIFYRVLAHDLSRNTSKPSDIVGLTKPDKIAPMPPVIDQFLVTDTSVVFSWISSPSKDVKKLIVMKKTGEGVFQPLKELSASDTILTDKAVQARFWYEYALVAMDSTGLRSELSFPLRVRVYPGGNKQGSNVQLTAVFNKEEKNVHLSWQNDGAKVASYLLYREINGLGLEMYQYLNGDSMSWVDTKAGKPGKYRYALKTKFSDGSESKLAEAIVEVK